MIRKTSALSFIVILLLTATGYGASTPKRNAKPAAPSPTATAGPTVLSDGWYTMQAGSTPFGYFHEIIENRDGRYSYRYALTKHENNNVYEENIGALAEADLTPIAFNLNKKGAGATESTNATFIKNKFGGEFKVEISGAKAASFKRGCPAKTILDVFFPVWLKENWSKLKPGYRGWVNTFAEDPERHDFRARMVRFEVKKQDHELGCLLIRVEMETVRGDWCMSPGGALVDLKVGSYHVRRVGSEAEAKAFMSGVLSKDKAGK